jgi:hypothetical protein
MAHEQWRFRLVVPLDNPEGLPQYGSLEVFLGPVEVLFERFWPIGSPGGEASNQALALIRKHCVQNEIAFQVRELAPATVSRRKKNGLALKLASAASKTL